MARLTEEMVIARSKQSDLSSIKKLNCWGAELGDVSLLRRMPNVEVLAFSINKIRSLEDFSGCRLLRELYVRKNEIRDLREIRHLRHLPALTSLWLDENPCTHHPQYRLTVLRNLPRLETLDNVAVQQEELDEAQRRGSLIDSDDEGYPQQEAYADSVRSGSSRRAARSHSNESSPERDEPVRHDDYHEPARHDDYRESARHDDYREPARHDDYREPVRHDDYREPARHDDYREPVRHEEYREHARHDQEPYRDHQRHEQGSDSSEGAAPEPEPRPERQEQRPQSPRRARGPPADARLEHPAAMTRSHYDPRWARERDAPLRHSVSAQSVKEYAYANGEAAPAPHEQSCERERADNRSEYAASTAGRGEWEREAHAHSAGFPSAVMAEHRGFTRRPVTRNSNLLSAVLCLVKELDYPSLEVTEMAVRCRMDELANSH